MLNSFTCHNFRNIDVDDLHFSRVNLLVGPNNSGKSNFIKSLTFMSELVANQRTGKFNSSFLNAVSSSGWDHMRDTAVSEDTPIEFQWSMNLNDDPVRYTFKCVVGDTVEKCKIVEESLTSVNPAESWQSQGFNFFKCHERVAGKGYFSTAMYKGKRNNRISLDINNQETVLQQFKDLLLADKRMYNSEFVRSDIAFLLQRLNQFFCNHEVFSVSQFDSNTIRRPAEVRNLDSLLIKSGANFVNVFSNTAAENARWRLEFIKYFKQLIPSIEDISVGIRYDHLVIQLCYDDMISDLTDVSEGTLKALLLNMIINMSPNKNRSLLALDEPETNLHPAWQKVVGNWILQSNMFDQCFISTHSPDFLDTFTDAFRQGIVSVFVFEPQNDSTCKIRKVEYDIIKEELGDWELGDLYRTNDPALGGWPW